MGGGGDGGASDMRKDEQARQAKIQSAVDAINGKFGIGSAGPVGAAPAREQFVTKGTPGTIQETEFGAYTTPTTDDSFDEAGYNKALAGYQTQQADVSGAKNARDALYTDISGAVKGTAMRDLDKQFTQASKQNLFGLARSGLLGGSVDAEAGGDLQTRYGEGRLKAEQAGLGAASDLRANDEKTRQNLIGLAQSGIDTGTAASLAAGQMSAAADVARSQTNSASVGDLFGNMSQAYLGNQQLKARYPNGLPQQAGNGGFFSNLFSGNDYKGRVTG